MGRTSNQISNREGQGRTKGKPIPEKAGILGNTNLTKNPGSRGDSLQTKEITRFAGRGSETGIQEIISIEVFKCLQK